MLGVAAVPALVYTLLCLGVPESPRWLLVFRGRREEAAQVLRRIDPDTADANIAILGEQTGTGVTNLVFTLVGLQLIDRLGRRTLMYIGSFGYIGSLGACSWAFFTAHYAVVPVCVFAFIAAHAIGQGMVIWVFISEIFPSRLRAAGQSLGSTTHWGWWGGSIWSGIRSRTVR
jgi:hypothetical protein